MTAFRTTLLTIAVIVVAIVAVAISIHEVSTRTNLDGLLAFGAADGALSVAGEAADGLASTWASTLNERF